MYIYIYIVEPVSFLRNYVEMNNYKITQNIM